MELAYVIAKEDIESIRNCELFDPEWYASQYPDVKILELEPAEHYLQFGWKLKRNPSLRFDTAAYLAAHPDVAIANINPLLHHIRSSREDYSNRPNGRAAHSPNDAATAPTEPHYGATFHRLIEEAWTRPVPGASSKEFDTIKAGFDMAYYLSRYMDIAQARIHPVKHYIDHGAKEGRDPSPEFNTKYYVKRYPDVAKSGLNPFYHYLTVGKREGRSGTPYSAGEPAFDMMCKILGRAPKDVENDLIERRHNLRARLERGTLGDMVRRAAELEPLIHHSWPAALETRFPPFHSESLIRQIGAMYQMQEAVGRRRASAVIAIRSCGVSGAARIAGHLAKALAHIYGADEVVVIRTDQSDMLFPDWFPDGCRHVDFAETVHGLSQVDQQRLLVEFLRSLRPVAAFNVNSRIFWDMMQSYGKALSKSMPLYAYLFCDDMNTFGHIDGYPSRQFYRYFEIYTGIIADSHYLVDSLLNRFQVPPSQRRKLVALRTPIDDPLPLAKAPSNLTKRRPQIFWSGRFDRQKRVDIVAALASRLPAVDFHLWGKPGLDKVFEQLKLPSNIFIEGVYKDFAELPLEKCDLWLYTSQWDGVPNVLFEVASTGIPLVGSLAGGCDEVLVEGLSERIANVEDIDAFEAAITRVLADPVGARERARQLRERMLIERAPTAYRTAVEELLPGRKLS